jgi:hypothetical protein
MDMRKVFDIKMEEEDKYKNVFQYDEEMLPVVLRKITRKQYREDYKYKSKCCEQGRMWIYRMRGEYLNSDKWRFLLMRSNDEDDMKYDEDINYCPYCGIKLIYKR